MLGKGKAAAITDKDIALLADTLEVHPAVLEAVSAVESGGFGWFNDGRMKILFEKHWFYKLTSGAIRGKAVNAGLARKNWISPSKGGYKDQKSAGQRYSLLQKAIDLDEEAAYQSISMGRYQIMGFNHDICGFLSAKGMFGAFVESEAHQLGAFANFLKSKDLVRSLQSLDWARVERLYNGGGLNGRYARKMESAYRKLLAGKWADYKMGHALAEQEKELAAEIEPQAPPIKPAEPVPAPPVSKPPKEVETALDDADKPLVKSKTAWGSIVAMGSSVLSQIGGFDKDIQYILIGIAVAAGVYILIDRKRKAGLARKAKAA